MGYKKIIFVSLVILVILGVYYRDYIPTTRTDFENLYYFVTEKETQNIIPQSQDRSLPPDTLQGEDESEPVLVSENETPDGGANSNTNTNTGQNNTNSNPLPEQKTNTNIPDLINNYIPFTSQAPTGVWDKFHDEACEEASLVMAHYYLDKRNVVFSNEAEKDIQYVGSKMKSGGMADLTVKEVKAAAESIYGYKNWRIVEKPSVQDIEKELVQGNIIIIPLAGREIGNPYYRNPGPLYHMLVISGYDNKKGVFITQDPGTRRGKDFEYKFSTLLKANHDAMGGDEHNIDQGSAKILIVIK
jgi:hypothetical protein